MIRLCWKQFCRSTPPSTSQAARRPLDLAKACSYAREFYLDRVNQFFGGVAALS